jgi:hypothetical protein
MLEFELLEDKGILILRPHGALSAHDFLRVAQQVDPFISSYGRLDGLLIDAPAFRGWDSFDALIEHLKFVRDHQHHIDRIAAVSDSALLHLAPRLAQHFAHPEFKAFAANQKAEALAWLEAKA